MTDFVPPEIEAGLEQGSRSSTLAFALFCLPRERREDMRAYYRFCRIIDDIADSSDLSIDRKRAALSTWKLALEGAHPPPEFLATLIARHSLDPALLREIVLGMEMDGPDVHYETFDQLRTYCWRVASAVGIACLPILGADRARSRTFAEELGLALQLTNIIRDVGEDARAGRVYLPASELAQFGLNSGTLPLREGTPEFLSLLSFQTSRARAYFLAAAAALPPEDRRALRAPRIMMRLYSALLDRIESDGFRVISRRYGLSRAEKIRLAVPLLFR